MKRFTAFWAILVAFLFSLIVFVPSVKAAPPQNFQTTLVAGSNLNGPSGFGFAPDGRIFILERAGKVKIFKNGQVLPTPFVDLPSAASGDRGLIGIAFDPDFATNHYVYFWYCASGDFLNRLVRFDASGDVATADPVQIYQTNIPSQELHVGGGLAFGADGKLYLGVGDNGYSANAQNLAVPFGKMLRINKDGSIPADNPFVGQQGALPEIWSYGHRNPWRAQFDTVTDRLYISDVGDNSWEEVNMITKGGNYGWPIVEGNCTANCGNFINPVHTYNHNGLSSAVTGGPVYRGTMFPASWQGKYFFGDYARGFIKTLTLNQAGTVGTVEDFDLQAGSVVDLKQAYDGSIYYITYFPGRLYRISYSTGNTIPVANAGANVTKGVDPLTVNFTSAGSFDPDGSALQYTWDFGDGTQSNAANPVKVFTQKGTYTVTLHVSDGVNISEAVPLVIQVGLPPTVRIAAPENNSVWRMGDTIFYTASGIDGAGFDLHDSDFTTEVLFHHDTHTHPFLGPIQSKTGTFTIPYTGEHDPDVYFEIIVTARDTNGLSTTERVNIYPVKVNYRVNTNIPGLSINVDGVPTVTPYDSPGVVRYQRELDAPMTQALNGKTYQFVSWSDGGLPRHIVSIPEQDVVWTATYQEIPSFNAEYFNNQNLTGVPAITRQDPVVDFDWQYGSPDPAIRTDNWSARWTRTQNFAAGTYTFRTTSDDGMRVYIDGNLVINSWVDQASLTHTGTIHLDNGPHEVKVEYYDNLYAAVARFTWDFVPDQVTPTAPPTIAPTAPPTDGFSASFWNLPGTGSSPAIPVSAPNYTRVDASVNFDWGQDSPAPGINTNHFAARWTKTQNFAAGTYQITTRSDDGIRVYIDNVAVIDQWNDHAASTHTSQVTLASGNHDIRVEYYDNYWDAVAQFSISYVGGATPVPTVTPTPVSGSYFAEYYNNMNLSGPAALTRNETVINNSWGFGSPDTIVPVDKFSARWTKTQNFASGVYTFTVTGDDGMRLYIDDVLVLNKWIDQASTTYTVDVPLQAGNHVIRFEYYENLWDAVAKLSFAKTSELNPTPTPVVTASPTAAPTAGTGSAITIYAAGNPANGVYPTMELRINDVVVATFNNVDGNATTATYKPYSYTHTVPVSANQIKVAFTNDIYVDDNNDRDLRVDKIVVDGVTYQSEDPAVYSTGTAVNDMCAVGNNLSEWLNCNGYFQYAGGTAPTPQPTVAPTAQPTVAPTVAPTAAPTGYTAEYWNTPDVGSTPPIPLTAPTLTRTEQAIDNYWGQGSPDPQIANNHFVARWTKTETFTAGTYELWTESDDGIRVYVDGTVVLDQWNDHAASVYTAQTTLAAGTHTIRVEYYENTGESVAKFRMTKQ